MTAIHLLMLFRHLTRQLRHWYVDAFDAHGGQELQRERKAKRAVVDLIDELLRVHGLVTSFQQARKFFIRELLTLARFFDEPSSSRTARCGSARRVVWQGRSR